MVALPFAGLAPEYAALWAAMKINPHKEDDVDAAARMIIRSRARYEKVAADSGVPWYVIGVIHKMEGNCNFQTHLHNGDSLKARTRQVPAGRPATGKPPFTWECSACDALAMKNLSEVTDWSIERIAYELENYNGWGYRRYHAETLSPYLWSYSNHYRSGKYIADGKWSSSAISSQGGALPILKKVCELEGITLHSEFDAQDAVKETIEEEHAEPPPRTEFPKTPEAEAPPAPAEAPPAAPPADGVPIAAKAREPDPATADEGGGWLTTSGRNFSVLNSLIEQGSRTARVIKHGKDAVWGTLASLFGGGAYFGKSGTFVVIALMLGAIALAVYVTLKLAEKYFVAAAKDQRYSPQKG